jgi:hypothetical protein
VAVGFTLYLWGPLGSARWDLIDDHEIMHLVGPGGRLALTHIPSRLLQETEVGQAGHASRFRPVYYALRLLECSAWGLEPSRWYLARQVLFGVTVFIALALAAQAIGVPAAVFCLAWVLAAPYWPDVWARLGASESYAAFGLAVWGAGFAVFWRGRRRPDGGPARLGAGILLLGFVLASGAKENLLVLLLPTLVVLWTDVSAAPPWRLRVWAGALAGLWAFLVAGPLVAHLATTGVDVYDQPVSFGARLAVALRSVSAPTPLHLAGVVSLAVWIGARWLRSAGAQAESWRSLGSTLLIASLALLAFYISQDVFYNGILPTGTRYDFPAMLAWPLWLVVAVTAVQRLFPGRAVRLGACAVFLALLVMSAPGLARNRSMAVGVADATRAFTARLTALAEAGRRAPQQPIVITSHRVLDFEGVVSVPRFLDAYGVANPRFLYLAWDDPDGSASTPLEHRFAGLLRVGATLASPYYQPIGQFRPDLPCLSVGLSGEPLAVCSGFGRLR